MARKSWDEHIESLVEEVRRRSDEFSGITPVSVDDEPAFLGFLFVDKTERPGRAAALIPVPVNAVVPILRDRIIKYRKICCLCQIVMIFSFLGKGKFTKKYHLRETTYDFVD